MGANMKYTVCGIDRTSGLQIVRTIDAQDPPAAEAIASRSMVVFDVEPAEGIAAIPPVRISAPKAPALTEPIRRLAFTLCLLILAGLLCWSAHEKELDQQRLASAAHHALAITPKLAAVPPELTRPGHPSLARPPAAPALAPSSVLHGKQPAAPAAASKTA